MPVCVGNRMRLNLDLALVSCAPYSLLPFLQRTPTTLYSVFFLRLFFYSFSPSLDFGNIASSAPYFLVLVRCNRCGLTACRNRQYRCKCHWFGPTSRQSSRAIA